MLREASVFRVVLFNVFHMLATFVVTAVGKLQISAQEEFGAVDDGVSGENFADLWRQLSQGLDGGPEAIFEGGETLNHLRRGRLGADYCIEFDFPWNRFHLQRDRGLIHIIARRRRNRKHRHRLHLVTCRTILAFPHRGSSIVFANDLAYASQLSYNSPSDGPRGG